MRMTLNALVIALGTLHLAAPVEAHHAFAAQFDADKPITLKGSIVSMDWVNPHAWLYITVKDETGQSAKWAIEFGGPNSLYRRGWKRTDLPVGAEVTVQGFLAKDGTKTVNASNVTLPTGRTLFAGSSGGPGAPEPK